jgi:hypothetical protein
LVSFQEGKTKNPTCGQPFCQKQAKTAKRLAASDVYPLSLADTKAPFTSGLLG